MIASPSGGSPLIAGESAADRRPALNLVMLSGSREYESDASLSTYQQHLAQTGRATAVLLRCRDGGDVIPGIEAVATADVLLVFTRRMTVPEATLAVLRRHCLDGKAVIGLRTASHGFQGWPEFDRQVLGGNYRGHGADLPAALSRVPEQAGHPLLAGVQPLWSTRKLYRNPDLPAASLVLLRAAESGRPAVPVAWAHPYRLAGGEPGRAFATSLGTQADFAAPAFIALLDNALVWATGQGRPETVAP